MEKSTLNYEVCVKNLLKAYEKQNTPHSKVELIFDDARKRYLVLRVGWFEEKRLHLCLVHIDLVADKVIIQANNTEDLIASELETLGIPREKIVLGFLPPHLQDEAKPQSAINATTAQLLTANH